MILYIGHAFLNVVKCQQYLTDASGINDLFSINTHNDPSLKSTSSSLDLQLTCCQWSHVLISKPVDLSASQ